MVTRRLSASQRVATRCTSAGRDGANCLQAPVAGARVAVEHDPVTELERAPARSLAAQQGVAEQAVAGGRELGRVGRRVAQPRHLGGDRRLGLGDVAARAPG